jgi:hypothetical protein
MTPAMRCAGLENRQSSFLNSTKGLGAFAIAGIVFLAFATTALFRDSIFFLDEGLVNSRDNFSNTPLESTRSFAEDLKLAEIYKPINRLRIEFALLATQKASTEPLQDWALGVLSQFRDDPGTSVSTGPNSEVVMIEEATSKILDSLRSRRGLDFDRAFQQLQIEWSRAILKKIGTKASAELKDLEFRQAFERLHHQIQEDVENLRQLHLTEARVST